MKWRAILSVRPLSMLLKVLHSKERTVDVDGCLYRIGPTKEPDSFVVYRDEDELFIGAFSIETGNVVAVEPTNESLLETIATDAMATGVVPP